MTVKCSCHNLHLCAKYAYKALPPEICELLHLVPAYFSHSRDRRAQLSECLKLLKLDNLQVLKSGETRWLTFRECAIRIYQQLEALFMHFTAAVFDQPSENNNRILILLKDPLTKICLEFFINGK